MPVLCPLPPTNLAPDKPKVQWLLALTTHFLDPRHIQTKSCNIHKRLRMELFENQVVLTGMVDYNT